jgi:hypothetical protein
MLRVISRLFEKAVIDVGVELLHVVLLLEHGVRKGRVSGLGQDGEDRRVIGVLALVGVETL